MIPTGLVSRRLGFWALLVLLVSNLGVGIVGLLSLRELDRNYDQLVRTGLPTLNAIRTATRELGLVQRTSLRATVAASREERESQLSRLARARAELAAQMRRLPAEESLDSNVDWRPLKEAAALYESAVDEFLTAIRSDRTSEATLAQREEMRPLHDRFQEELDRAAEQTLRVGSRMSEEQDRDVRSFAWLFVLFSSLPLTLVLVGLLVTMFASLILLVALSLMGKDERR